MKLTCELFEYGNEALDTGIEGIDSFETSYATRTELTLGAGSGTYQVGEDVTQINATSGITVTGEVAVVGSGKIEISSQVASDGSNTLFAPTSAGTTGNIIGSTSTASYIVSSTDAFNAIDNNDPYADNVDFETFGNSFIDFTETNPFGVPDVTT